MPYTRASLADFVAAFPAFTSISDPQYDFWATRAERIITDAFGDDQQFCTMLLTAHYLVKAGIGSGAEATVNARGMGGFTKIDSGSLSLERGSGSNASSAAGEYATTQYGQQLWPWLKAVFGGPLVTGTGVLPCYGGPLPGWQG